MNFDQKCKFYRLSSDEVKLATELLGRPIKDVEWPLFSALWSEHCSYKSSKIHLKKLFSKNERTVQMEGENAGVIDLGQNESIAFKMESHNHPSFIEPFQGAATGVGGILRDIFTMGARPVALANYLCFGEPKAPRMGQLVDGVVRGISSYGNCVGVPNLTGQTHFHKSYNGNILVNAMAVGLFRPGEKIATAKASGPGNKVIYVGAKTGKDGVHGAAMASESFDGDSESKKPNVQIGDPYFEKLLIEACLEVIQSNLVVAMQDMGAAGLTSSSFEMVARGGVGLDLYLDQVPLRDSTMTPEEILLSESQERMLMVVEDKNLDKVKSIFDRWDLDSAVIGEIKLEKRVKLIWKGECLTEIDPEILVEKAPRYDRPHDQPSRPHRKERINVSTYKPELSDICHANRECIYQQYDQRVGAKTVLDCSSPVGMIRLPDSQRGLMVAVGCRPELMRLDVTLGAYDSVAYPALQMACQGAEVLAVTDCLNFGNPEKTGVMGDLVNSIECISSMAKALNAPIISGNVSLYNETMGVNVTPTPATGLVGLRPHVKNLKQSFFTKAGERVYILRLGQVQFVDLDLPSMQWEGDFDVTLTKRFIQGVQKLALTTEVETIRSVGSYGIKVSMEKMSLAGYGILNLPNQPQCLYEVIVAGKHLMIDEIAKCISISDVEIIDLGQTEVMDVKQSRIDFLKGVEAYFEELS